MNKNCLLVALLLFSLMDFGQTLKTSLSDHLESYDEKTYKIQN
jgi:hypothetical protein